MNCKTVRTYGLALLDQELAPRRSRRIQAHLHRCEACRQVLARMEELYETAGPSGTEPPPARLRYRIEEAIDRWEYRRSLVTLVESWAPRAASACAAALLMLAGVAAGIYLGSDAPDRVSAEEQRYNTVSGLDRFDDLQPESLGMVYIALTVPEDEGSSE